MRKQAQTQIYSKSQTSVTSKSSNLLQRQYECGKSAELEQQSEFSHQSLTLQQQANELTELTEAPPVLHELLKTAAAPKIQAKLKVGAPNDKYEQEADRIAAQTVPLQKPDTVSQTAITLLPKERVQLQSSSSLSEGYQSDFDQRIDALKRSGGKQLPHEVKSSMEARIGQPLGHISIHDDSRSQALANDLGARAFTLGNQIAFGAGNYQPHTQTGQRLIAHELVHTLQQAKLSTNQQFVQRDIIFDEEAAQSTRRIIDPETGKETESDSAFSEFVSGLYTYLAISVDTKNGTEITNPVEDDARATQIEKLFKLHYTPPVEVIQSRDTGTSGGGRFVDETKIVDFDSAIKTWENIRKQVIDRIDGILDVDINTSKTAPAPVGAPSSLNAGGEGDILINPNLLQETVFSKAVNESFDFFWILLHEMRHLEGKDDPHPTSSSDVLLKKERPQNLQGNLRKKNRISLLGQAVSDLNILRIGFGLPLRTNYAEDGIVHFTTEGPISFAETNRTEDNEVPNVRGEIRGAVFGTEKSPAKPSKLTFADKFIKDDRTRRQRLLQKMISGSSGSSTWEGKFFNNSSGLASLTVVTLNGVSPNISGNYHYDTQSQGKVEGKITNGQVFNVSLTGIGLLFNWQERGGESGRAFMLFDGIKSLEGTWGFDTSLDDGGLWKMSINL